MTGLLRRPSPPLAVAILVWASIGVTSCSDKETCPFVALGEPPESQVGSSGKHLDGYPPCSLEQAFPERAPIRIMSRDTECGPNPYGGIRCATIFYGVHTAANPPCSAGILVGLIPNRIAHLEIGSTVIGSSRRTFANGFATVIEDQQGAVIFASAWARPGVFESEFFNGMHYNLEAKYCTTKDGGDLAAVRFKTAEGECIVQHATEARCRLWGSEYEAIVFRAYFDDGSPDVSFTLSKPGFLVPPPDGTDAGQGDGGGADAASDAKGLTGL